MPPKDGPPAIRLAVPGAPSLIPDDIDDADGTFGGIPVVAAKKLTRDAFNALFYAYPGVGKTTLSGMFADYPPARDVLAVDAEGGASVLSDRDYVDVASVKTWLEVDKILTALERTSLDKLKYRTVTFDNLTEIHSLLIKHIVGSAEVQIQHHGRALSELMRFTRRVRDLSRYRGINTVLIGWEESKEDKERGITRKTVALTDKLSGRIPGIPNNVGHITILNNPPLYTRKLSFVGSPMNDAKLRRAPGDDAPAIPLEIYYSEQQNPILDMLLTLYEGVPFPTDKYQRPTRKGQNATKQASDAEGTDSAEGANS